MTEEKQQQIQLDIGTAIPLFANGTAIAVEIRAKKIDEKRFEKEGFVNLIFFDNMTRKALARIVLPETLAEEFQRSLGKTLEQMAKDIKSNELPKQQKMSIVQDNKSYFG